MNLNTSTIRNKRAFTLVEIVVTLIIMGTLVAMGVANYNKSLQDAYKKDACNNLRAIYASQQIYMENSSDHTYYTPCSTDDTVDLNGNLGLNISSSGNTKYNCCLNNGSLECKAFLNSGAELEQTDCQQM